MDFFERQSKARKKTWLLALYFIAAIVFIVVAVNLAFYFFFKFTEAYPYTPKTWFTEHVWMYVTGATLAIILSGSFFRFAKLASGGKAVAEMAGARLLDLSTHDSNEKKFINVVEEMSIASGTPMPVLYVMDNEHGINAFVAGYKPTEAVMVVTQGTLETLNRDELQGVVGHEFSHILNGDMRINIRLMAILAGILVIGQIGQFMLRGSGRRSYSRSKKGDGQGALMVLAIGLMVIGYIGLFFGRLIKAAISRQREFLADASSVQFTRNPKGIAGALYKIQQSVDGTLLNNSHAEDMSHMCFGEALHVSMQSLLATHPPLDERIKAVDAGFLKIQRAKDIIKNRQQSEVKTDDLSETASIHTHAQNVSNSVGNPTPEHMAYAVALHHMLAPSLMDNVHNISGAKAVIYALLISDMDIVIGLQCLRDHGESDQVEKLRAIESDIKKLNKRYRLPLIDLALPVLKQLSEQEITLFLETTEALIKSDKKYTLFEFVLLTILKKHLDKDAAKADKVKIYSFKSITEELKLLLSLMGHASKQPQHRKQAAYEKGMTSFGVISASISPVDQCNPRLITQILNKLSQLSPLLKKSVIDACVDMVLDDGIIMPIEAELLRAISEVLDCPMPPLLSS
jgi:Zn-dependent protease with chaperone function